MVISYRPDTSVLPSVLHRADRFLDRAAGARGEPLLDNDCGSLHDAYFSSALDDGHDADLLKFMVHDRGGRAALCHLLSSGEFSPFSALAYSEFRIKCLQALVPFVDEAQVSKALIVRGLELHSIEELRIIAEIVQGNWHKMNLSEDLSSHLTDFARTVLLAPSHFLHQLQFVAFSPLFNSPQLAPLAVSEIGTLLTEIWNKNDLRAAPLLFELPLVTRDPTLRRGLVDIATQNQEVVLPIEINGVRQALWLGVTVGLLTYVMMEVALGGWAAAGVMSEAASVLACGATIGWKIRALRHRFKEARADLSKLAAQALCGPGVYLTSEERAVVSNATKDSSLNDSLRSELERILYR